MSNLLLNELLKLKKSWCVKVVFIILMAYSALIAVFPGSDGSVQRSGFSAPFMLLINYASLGFWANAAIASGQTAGEFEAGTIHNTLICGTERGKYFAAKVISLYGITAALYLAGSLFVCLCKNLVFEYDPEGMIFSRYLAKVLVFQLGAFIVIFSYLSLTIFFSYLFRGTVASFVATVAATLADTFLSGNALLGGPVNTVRRMMEMVLNNDASDHILSMDFLITLFPCILLNAAAIGGAYYLFKKSDIN